jgi:hypothetical protein
MKRIHKDNALILVMYLNDNNPKMTDSEICRALNVPPWTINNLRNKTVKYVKEGFLLRLIELYGKHRDEYGLELEEEKPSTPWALIITMTVFLGGIAALIIFK